MIGISLTFGVIIGISSCGSNVNTVQDPSFDKFGKLNMGSKIISLSRFVPSRGRRLFLLILIPGLS